jgi:hypothetical protein
MVEYISPWFFFFDLVASLISFDFNSTADSDGIPLMKAFPQCQFGWDSSYEGFPAMPIRMGLLQ